MLTLDEAMRQVSLGKKVTHLLFTDGEHLKRNPDSGDVETEEGYAVGYPIGQSIFWELRSSEVWLKDWEVIKEEANEEN